MKTVCLLFIGLIISCKSTETINNKTRNYSAVLSFVNSAKFIYSTSKTVIPDVVLDSLRQINGGKFALGDSSEMDRVKLTDTYFPGFYYDKILHFVLVNDSICLLSYTQGGRGTYTVIDFAKYKSEFSCLRYETSQKITDVEKLKTFLESNPKPAAF